MSYRLRICKSRLSVVRFCFISERERERERERAFIIHPNLASLCINTYLTFLLEKENPKQTVFLSLYPRVA